MLHNVLYDVAKAVCSFNSAISKHMYRSLIFSETKCFVWLYNILREPKAKTDVAKGMRMLTSGKKDF